MAKKITTKEFEGVETNDAAFRQMMANLDSMPSIDIDPYAFEEKRPNAETEDDASVSAGREDKPEPADASGAARTTPRRSARKQQARPSSGSRAMTAMPISEHARDSLNLAKQFYCKVEGVKMTREEFLLLMTEKSLKKLSPKAYEHWILVRDTDGGD